jgi:acyl-coenzyme A thioesterase PaaI-like protein
MRNAVHAAAKFSLADVADFRAQVAQAPTQRELDRHMNRLRSVERLRLASPGTITSLEQAIASRRAELMT